MSVNLNCLNFSYYAFHPKSSELSPRDRKVALGLTVLMGVTCGIGHFISACMYHANKTGIDSSRSSPKTHAIAMTNAGIQPEPANELESAARIGTKETSEIEEEGIQPGTGVEIIVQKGEVNDIEEDDDVYTLHARAKSKACTADDPLGAINDFMEAYRKDPDTTNDFLKRTKTASNKVPALLNVTKALEEAIEIIKKDCGE